MTKIILTGATGFIGQQIVPVLSGNGAELLIVSRHIEIAIHLFPGQNVCSFNTLKERGRGFDVLVHMAAANNDHLHPEMDFETANVSLTREVLETARELGIGLFVNMSTVHALNPKTQSAYARTKREAALIVSEASSSHLRTLNLYLPAVYGSSFKGRLGLLNILPRQITKVVLPVLAALRPIVHVSRIPAFLQTTIERGLPQEYVLTDGQSNNLVYRTLSRGLDLLAVAVVVGALWWLMLIAWSAVRLGSPGPGLFKQVRIGRHQQPFTCYKFRSMKQGTVHRGTHEISKTEVTRVGAFLRRTKIDELPQLWNVLKGEMGLVGPRPCLPVQKELIEARDSHGVFNVRPGITGLAQINGIDMSTPERLAVWDERYIALRSLSLDLKLILCTASGNGQGDRPSKDADSTKEKLH